ncbi:winged helix DNA-binding domain-containing protein [Salinibacterium sp. ZJ450]|uniref:winged helix DNA-binding domain-containing protein n=1 Tax=Salinibacterium sp. ZJ450 TaxID=2708338 RepID=UPI0014210898|nr:winged helix DNA-binding domain-containing protein [Salinibacterium sp. ZJ450]
MVSAPVNRRRLAELRLMAQAIARPTFETPAAVVRHMLGMQAQDFAGALWSVGLRTTRATQADVVAALASGDIVRSWPLRGTLHFVPGEDLAWMLGVTAPRLIAGAATRHRGLGLDSSTFESARAVAETRLTGSGVLARNALLREFDRHGIDTGGQRGYHILWYLGQTGTLVFGPPDGRTQTFTLLDEWVRHPRRLERDEALGEFALRYFSSHGPATVRDFAWWASLTLRDARAGLAVAGEALTEIESDGVAYFLSPQTLDAARPTSAVRALPGFDEYLLGYQDRSAVIMREHLAVVVPGGNGMFFPTIVVDGEVVGVWRRTGTAGEVEVIAEPFGELSDAARAGFDRAVQRFGRFLGTSVHVLPPE